MVSIFLFSPRSLGKISNLTNIFQMGWNHQLVLQQEHTTLGKWKEFLFGCSVKIVGWYGPHGRVQEKHLKLEKNRWLIINLYTAYMYTSLSSQIFLKANDITLAINPYFPISWRFVFGLVAPLTRGKVTWIVLVMFERDERNMVGNKNGKSYRDKEEISIYVLKATVRDREYTDFPKMVG